MSYQYSDSSDDNSIEYSDPNNDQYLDTSYDDTSYDDTSYDYSIENMNILSNFTLVFMMFNGCLIYFIPNPLTFIPLFIFAYNRPNITEFQNDQITRYEMFTSIISLVNKVLFGLIILDYLKILE